MKTFTIILSIVTVTTLNQANGQTTRRSAENNSSRSSVSNTNTTRNSSNRSTVSRGNSTNRDKSVTQRSTNRQAQTRSNQSVNRQANERTVQTSHERNQLTRPSNSTPGSQARSVTARNVQSNYPGSVSSRTRVNASAPGRQVHSTRVYRGTHKHTYANNYRPYPRSYREVHYVYRRPVHYVNYVWSRRNYHYFSVLYPEVRFTWYPTGYRIELTSAYRAEYYIGDIASIYGKVKDVYYSYETDEYFLYFGDYYPYHDFTAIIPGNIARYYSHRPEWFFTNEHIVVSGLVTAYKGNPEIVVKNKRQLDVY